MNKQNDDKVLLTRLYVNKSNAGKEYLGGNMGSARVIAFEGTDDSGQRYYDVFLTRREKRKQDAPRDDAPAINDSIPF